MNDQTTGITNVGKMRKQLDTINDLLTRFIAPLDTKGKDSTSPTRELAFGQRI